MSGVVRRGALLGWAAGILLLAAASALLRVVPSEAESERPFVIEAGIGETAQGRTIEVTVDDAVLVQRLTAGSWEQEGRWLLVELSAAARGSEASTYLGRVALVLDPEGEPREYRSSERFPSFSREQLVTGLPRSGSVAFELPAGAGGQATLEFAEHADTRLDSVIRVPLDLDTLPELAHGTVQRERWATERGGT